MLLLTTNKKPRYIIHGVPKDTLIILHTPQRRYDKFSDLMAAILSLLAYI